MIISRIYFLLLFFTYALLIACTPSKDKLKSTAKPILVSERAKTYVYECPNEYNFTVSTEGEQAWLFLPEQTIRVTQVPAASGTKYQDKQITFWAKGNNARLQLGKKTYEACTNNRAKAIWEHAKLNGVDFRALGNEPGWNLEIIRDETIVFSYFYDGITNLISQNPILIRTPVKRLIK